MSEREMKAQFCPKCEHEDVCIMKETVRKWADNHLIEASGWTEFATHCLRYKGRENNSLSQTKINEEGN